MEEREEVEGQRGTVPDTGVVASVGQAGDAAQDLVGKGNCALLRGTVLNQQHREGLVGVGGRRCGIARRCAVGMKR